MKKLSPASAFLPLVRCVVQTCQVHLIHLFLAVFLFSFSSLCSARNCMYQTMINFTVLFYTECTFIACNFHIVIQVNTTLSSGLTSSETRVNVRRMNIFHEAHAINISFLASTYTERPPMQREERLREIKERHKSHSC